MDDTPPAEPTGPAAGRALWVGSAGLLAAAALGGVLHQQMPEGSPAPGWAPWLVFGLGAFAAVLLAALTAQRQRTAHPARPDSPLQVHEGQPAATGPHGEHALAATREGARALAAEHERLQRIIDATQIGTWELDLRTGETRHNRHYADMLGYTLDEWMRSNSPRFADLVHPDDAPGVEQDRLKHLQGLTREYRSEFRMRHRSGRWIWVGSRGLVVDRDAEGQACTMAGIHLDITERRQAQAEVQRSALVLHSAINALDEAFVVFDPEDRLLMCNEKYREVYRLSAEVIRPGVPFEELLRHGLQRGQFPAAQGREEEWVAERMEQHRSGIATIVQPLDDGRTMRIIERRTPDGCIVGFRVDISELVRARQAAEQADRSKSEFIATISHELRTPLQSVIGFSELGQHFAAGKEPFGRMFDDIHAGGHRMLTLVNALLDVSKIEAGGTAAKAEPADLALLASQVVQELRPQLTMRSLTVHLPRPLPVLRVRVDSFRIQQVIRNVLANAIRFAPLGSVIEIDGGLDLDDPAGPAWLSVRDHGPGIPPAELKSIFEPFVQSTRTRDGSGGTGLGLTICQKILRVHGGRIEADNAAGGGAVMKLWLPGDGTQPLVAPPPSTEDSTAAQTPPSPTIQPQGATCPTPS